MILIKKLLQSKKPILMGILNLTPDSFSDGNSKADPAFFLDKAEKLISEGADILDIGGESTRPHAKPVSLEEEKSRVLPFLEEFRKKHPDFLISLDTKKFDLAKQCLEYHINILNDVSFLADERFIDLVNQADVYYVLMHSRGDSKSMMGLTEYPEGVVEGILQDFEKKISYLKQKNFPMERLILDPGFGFAKTPEQCVELIENLTVWQKFRLPLLFGISRKRFLEKYTGPSEPRDRDGISAELALQAWQNGFQIIRTHNVALTKKVFGRDCERVTG